jgi:excisionase family DNA binding protein
VRAPSEIALLPNLCQVSATSTSPLNTPEVARILDVSTATVRRLTATGVLPSRQPVPRGTLRFAPEDVEALLEQAKRIS